MNSFEIRTYGRTELAQLYCPDLCPESAYRKLKHWIDLYPGLRAGLSALGAFSPFTLLYARPGEPDSRRTGGTLKLRFGGVKLRFSGVKLRLRDARLRLRDARVRLRNTKLR